jgi:hypothetical protein
MPTKKVGLRLLLDPATEHHVRQFALNEGRSMTAMACRLIWDGLRFRRGEVPEVGKVMEELVHLIRTGESAAS